MVELTRRRFIGATGVAAGMLAVPAIRTAQAAPQFEYKYANNLPLTHPLNIRAQAAADAIKKDTNGAFELKIFPNNQLGSDTDVLGQLRSGAVEFFTLSGLILSTLVPVASINGIGFAFPDYPTVWKAMDGDLGAYIRSAIEKRGLHPMEKIWDNGFRQTTSSTHPIASPKDLEGFKIRVPVSPLWTSMYEAFGASPTSINFAEVYPALQTKIVEGQENPLAIIQTAKLYEVQKYLSMTNHMWDGFWFLANADMWAAIPPDMQTIVAKHINDAAVLERADTEKLNATLGDKLKTEGMVINAPDAGPFRDRLRSAGFYATWKKKYGEKPWNLLEEAVGNLT